MASREEVKAEIALSVSLLLRLNPPERLYAGWLHLFQLGIDPAMIGRGQQVPPDVLERLLRDVSTDAEAFDACSTLAGLQLGAGVNFAPSLQEFAADTLMGKARRPTRTKRSVGRGIRDNITRYIVLKQALRFFPMQKGRGLRTENGLRAKSEYSPDAYSVISEALTEGGLDTTSDQLKNLLNHPSKKAVREFGNWAMEKD